jgi:hypothetical protein
VKNNNAPGGGKLPEADAAGMETFFENIRLLLPTLGVNVFTTDPPVARNGDSEELTLELRLDDDAKAECVVREGQFVVKAGSFARAREVDSLGDGSRALRKTLRESGVLVPVKGTPALLKFTQEYSFDSPSGAAAVVSGTGLNGGINWKLSGSGMSYKEWQEKQVSAAGDV